MSAARLYRESSGAGAPLVLLHGWAMNLRVFDDLRARLAPHFAVSAVDLPGHGRSAWPWGPAVPGADRDTAVGLTRQLELIEQAVPDGAVLVGWSLGGQLALALAARGSRTLCGLALIATTPRFVQAADWPHGLAPATLQQFADALGEDAAGTITGFLDLQVRGSAGAGQARAALGRALQDHGMARPEALQAGLELLRQLDQRDRVGGIRVPTLVISGTNDRITPPAAGAALAALLPQGRQHLVARAGHAPFLSHGAEVAGALRAFIDGDGAGAGARASQGGRR